ncbi:DUF6114 domain-containing protein [Nocardioides sp. WS12]|uniref:DUF6114 domain-containing protein n=1 Tax=Nocardioides sp. WS12 TaxID=2486272 RepID=UPI0015FA46B1|nr:DUF6114 domain-containing protein [Nocardioides sp. WS12]
MSTHEINLIAQSGPDESASPVTEPDHTGTGRSHVGTVLHAANRWRRTRPLAGCVILALGGWFVVKPVIGSASMTLELGAGAMAGYLLGGGMILAALIALVLPAQRHFPALMATLMSVASLPLANLGGWLIGMILGIIGSGIVFAWTPYTDKQLAKFAARAERRAAARDARRAGRVEAGA